MEFRSMTSEDYVPVRQFLSEVGWRHRVADLEKFKKMLQHTNRTVVAVEGSRIVGFARALCDEASNGYISMVAVAPDKRGQGIGRELVRRLIRDDTEITWLLRAGHGSNGFRERQPSAVAMEKVRTWNS
jgi:ribosomal protein S18 acetylase RimI-like enzyme